MSWSDSLLIPPDESLDVYSYPPIFTNTDTSLPHPHPNAYAPSFTHDPPRAPRLSSPRLLRDTLFPPSNSGIPGRSLLPRPVPDYDFDNTLRDVQSALYNADMALRNAQAAFRHGRATRSNTSNVVDLTGSDDTNEHDHISHSFAAASNRQREAQQEAQRLLHNARIYEPQNRVMRMQATAVGGLYAHGTTTELDEEGSDSEEDEHHQREAHGGRRMIPLRSIMRNAQSNVNQAERSAVRRQRQARRNWERVERRNRERAEQQTQNNTQNSLQRSQPQGEEPVVVDEQHSITQSSHRRRNSTASATPSISEVSMPSIDLTQNTRDEDSSIPVDLTGADDDKTLKDILAKEQQDAIAAQPKSSTNSNAVSSLSNYKCAICMDAPTNATTTICGHLFCHRCIVDSLKWSERQRREDALHPRTVNGLCPVCRKPLKNKEVTNAARGSTGGLVNLEIKKVTRKQYNDDKNRDRFLANIDAGKGKQRAETEDVTDIENIDMRDDDVSEASTGLGRGMRKRRRGQT